MSAFKPMLAGKAPKDIKFPVLCSPKIDGVRCLIYKGQALSRSLKPIRNKWVQYLLGGKSGLNGLDGELVVGYPWDSNCMQTTTSGVMSIEGEPPFNYYVFDNYGYPDDPYKIRLELVKEQVEDHGSDKIIVLDSKLVNNQKELDDYEATVLSKGFEGIIIRSLDGPYKFGRSSTNQGYLLKLKRYEDAEAIVLGVEELMHNDNPAKKNALGRTERSTSAGGLIGAGTLGCLLVKDKVTGIEFGVGTGYTESDRYAMWKVRKKLVGKTITYKHFANAGVKDAPRFPVFKSFRDEDDT